MKSALLFPEEFSLWFCFTKLFWHHFLFWKSQEGLEVGYPIKQILLTRKAKTTLFTYLSSTITYMHMLGKNCTPCPKITRRQGPSEHQRISWHSLACKRSDFLAPVLKQDLPPLKKKKIFGLTLHPLANMVIFCKPLKEWNIRAPSSPCGRGWIKLSCGQHRMNECKQTYICVSFCIGPLQALHSNP